MKKLLESDIQLAICDYLSVRKHFFWRSNTTPIFDSKRGTFRRMPKYAISGVPDVILVKDGTFIGLEVKRPTGQISASQALFKERLERSGGRYHIVTSIDDVQKLGL